MTSSTNLCCPIEQNMLIEEIMLYITICVVAVARLFVRVVVYISSQAQGLGPAVCIAPLREREGRQTMESPGQAAPFAKPICGRNKSTLQHLTTASLLWHQSGLDTRLDLAQGD